MTELASEQSNAKRGRLKALLENPVTVKELRSRMRGRRGFVVLTVYLTLMSGFIALVYLAYASSTGPLGLEPRVAGQTIFAAVVGVQVFLVIFIGPAFTAGAISGEKERQTYDLLRTTLLSAESFVTGKLFSALSYVFLLVFASVPIQSIAFLLGGVSLVEVVISQILVLIAAVSFALWGLYCSTAMKTTMAASVATFAGALFVTAGIPILVFLFGAILGPMIFSVSLGWVAQAIWAYAAVVLAATNLPATLIASEIFLIENNAIFYYSFTISGHAIYVPSPWPFFLLLYGFAAFWLYWACVRRVRRIADK